ncbi:O-antigen ligase like membrane protein [Prevotella sp. khp1]|uniref:O-antigen ligase family protein n=1 Tax=Prevotellaceae TaxID=171552 RepID=UPI0008833F86|nr:MULTISPECIES: O-antigen ligase family protein [Prevotellaceae]QVJ80733.1 O-antigen ligase family protein [Xylanibacter ruminicola]SDQ15089.1 O-antigen ligase like membrane protein [Prevotella sp. khp1]
MVKKVYSNRISEYAHENGGRVIILFLLFLLEIYEFLHSGLSTFAAVCISPIIILAGYSIFKWRMAAFWGLIVANYLVSFKNIHIPVPISIIDEAIEILLIAMALIDARVNVHFERILNIMLLAISIWFGFCIVEIFNDTCGLGINISAWFTGARLMALHLLWILIVFSIYITTPQILIRYLKLWAFLSLFSAFWTWKMITFGLTSAEMSFLYGAGMNTHLLQAGTLIRYWSTFSDAANYGCNAACAALAFIIFGITSKIRKDKIFFLLTSIVVIWGMFQSGTRTAILCMAGGFVVFLVLSKSIRIMVPSAILGAVLLALLVFTNIGNSNQQIRRMRSAFDKKDASANVRDVNKAAIAKYMKDAPWGIGIGMYSDNIPTWNKFKLLSEIPPDSEYVFIWIRTGIIGVSIFALCMIIILSGASYVVLYKLKNQSLIGIGAGMCAAFTAIQLGGYANQVIYQYPNGVTFFGGMAIVYLLPYLEPEWIKYEQQRLEEQEKKKRLKLEKKLAKRV